MSNGELLAEVLAVLKEEAAVPSKVSQRFIIAGLVEVYKKLNKVESYIKGVDGRLITVEQCVDAESKSKENKTKDLKWALEKIGIPVGMLVLGIILAHIFGG